MSSTRWVQPLLPPASFFTFDVKPFGNGQTLDGGEAVDSFPAHFPRNRYQIDINILNQKIRTINQQSYSHVMNDATRKRFTGYHMRFLETIIFEETFYNYSLSVIIVCRYFYISCM